LLATISKTAMPVAQDRRGNEIESHRLGQFERRDFAAVKTGFEVPQGTFAPQRFVDRLCTARVVGNLHEERRVTAPRHATDDLDLAFREEAQRVVVAD